MSFTANFTVSQSNDCSRITITDASVYTSEAKNTFSLRKLELFRTDGTLITLPSAFTFANYPGDSITVTGIDRDYALNIVLTFTSTNPQNGSTYSKSVIVGFKCFIRQFQYGLVQQEAANNSLNNNPGFIQTKMKALLAMADMDAAITYSDQYIAQMALDRGKYLIDNQTILF